VPHRETPVESKGKFRHNVHPHTAARLNGIVKPVKTRDQRTAGKGPLGRLGGIVGLRITVIVGTMWTASLFTLLALISLPAALKSGNQIIIVAWIAQTFLQLVLLPVIIVGQNIMAKASDKRAEATFIDAEAVLHEARDIQRHLEHQDVFLTRLVDKSRPVKRKTKKA